MRLPRNIPARVPLDYLRLWSELLSRLVFVEEDEQQDSTKLQNLRSCTEIQAREIKALQTKVTQLDLASTPATVAVL